MYKLMWSPNPRLLKYKARLTVSQEHIDIILQVLWISDQLRLHRALKHKIKVITKELVLISFKQNRFMICKWDPHNSDPHTDEETIPYNSFRYAHDSHVLLIHLQMFLANIIVCSLTSRICCDLLTGRSCKHTQEMCSWYFCLSTAAQYSSAHALQKPSRLRIDVFWADALLFYICLHFFNIIFS